MIITLEPGERIGIVIKYTEGIFEIHYDTPEYPNRFIIEEVSGCPDDSGQEGVLYDIFLGNKVEEEIEEQVDEKQNINNLFKPGYR